MKNTKIWLVLLAVISIFVFLLFRKTISVEAFLAASGILILIFFIYMVGPETISEFSIAKSSIKRVIQAEQTVVKAEKSIKEVSGNLPSWQLLFEHDEQNNSMGGDIESLIEAGSKGYQIKVKIHQADNSTQLMEAQWVIVDNKVVYALNTSQISFAKDESGKYAYQKDSYHYYVIVGSDGYHHATRIYVDGRISSQTNSTRHMAWIGLVPPQTMS